MVDFALEWSRWGRASVSFVLLVAYWLVVLGVLYDFLRSLGKKHGLGSEKEEDVL